MYASIGLTELFLKNYYTTQNNLLLYFTDVHLSTFLQGISGVNKVYLSTCNVCGRSYSRKENLGRHRKFECGKDSQFHCTLCPYKAKQKGTLQVHLAVKHNSF